MDICLFCYTRKFKKQPRKHGCRCSPTLVQSPAMKIWLGDINETWLQGLNLSSTEDSAFLHDSTLLQPAMNAVGVQHAKSSSAVLVFSTTSMLRVTVRALLLFHTVVAINISPVDLASGKLIRCSEISISDTSPAYLCGIFWGITDFTCDLMQVSAWLER